MEVLKLVVTGPVGAGKSTFIRTISEIEVVDTDRRATDEIGALKDNTTVAFDFGKLSIADDAALHIYGTPGQERFDFIWDMLIDQAQGCMLLVAAHRPHEFRYARRILNFMQHRQSLPMMVGITHTDQEDAWSPENILFALGFTDKTAHPPYALVHPKNFESTAQAMMTLVNHIYETSSLQPASSTA